MTTPEQQLAGFRAQIDAIDDQLSQLLIQRTGIIHQVAALKRANWPNSCHIRPGREGQMHHAIAARFGGTIFPPLAALTIWRQLIGASTHLESPLNITVLEPEHQWLAREYFGVQVGLAHATTTAQALQNVQQNVSNILVLPAATHHAWWRDAATLASNGLFIFAWLPVAEGTLPPQATPAVALAPVTPEDSGNDISYFLRDGHIEAVDGFVPTREGAVFLGAHPRPVSLGETA